MRRAIANTFVVLVALAMLVGYLYGSPKYRALKKECVEAGMNHSDAPSDDDLNRLWMACRKRSAMVRPFDATLVVRNSAVEADDLSS